MIAIAKEHDVQILFSTWAHSPNLNDYAAEGYYQEGFRENNDVVKEVATSHAIPLFDFAAVMPQDEVTGPMGGMSMRRVRWKRQALCRVYPRPGVDRAIICD